MVDANSTYSTATQQSDQLENEKNAGQPRAYPKMDPQAGAGETTPEKTRETGPCCAAWLW